MKLENQSPSAVVKKIGEKLPTYELPTEIKNMVEYRQATDLGSKMAKALKDIEGIRDHYAKPHYDTYKNIRGEFAPFVDLLSDKIKALKPIMLAWHKEEQRLRDEEQKRLEAEAVKNAPEGAEVTVEVVNEIKTIDGGEGRSQVRTKKKWRVVDINKVPSKYLEVNKKEMDAAIKKGIVPPGIEEYEEESLAFSR